LIRFLFRLVVLLVILATGVAASGVWWAYSRFNAPGPSASDTTLVIARGSGVAAIARDLTTAGVIDNPLIFAAGVRLVAEGQPLKAGEYQFPAGISPRGAMQLMIDGTTVVRRLTVAEGLTSADIVALVAAADGLDGQVPASVPAEGSLLPETYFYSRGDSRADLLARMSTAMDKALAELWQGRDKSLPLKTPAEAVTLASIVEKETGVTAERPRVAAVFFNRLGQTMPLQSDPTVIFAVSNGQGRLDRPLSKADLQAPSSYNTYANTGLPPGPIANPGRASLEAVLHPLATKEFYFVADGSGGHVFAETLDQHNKNVAAWRSKQQKPQTTQAN
jgi:UPF0755 protein